MYQVEEELGEELMMTEALEAFEEQQEAALYAQENLPLPRHNNRQGRNNHFRQNRGGFRHAQGMNHMQQHMNGVSSTSANRLLFDE